MRFVVTQASFLDVTDDEYAALEPILVNFESSEEYVRDRARAMLEALVAGPLSKRLQTKPVDYAWLEPDRG